MDLTLERNTSKTASPIEAAKKHINEQLITKGFVIIPLGAEEDETLEQMQVLSHLARECIARGQFQQLGQEPKRKLVKVSRNRGSTKQETFQCLVSSLTKPLLHVLRESSAAEDIPGVELPAFIASEPGCEIQPEHRDYNFQQTDDALMKRPDKMFPYSAIIATEEETRLHVKPGSH